MKILYKVLDEQPCLISYQIISIKILSTPIHIDSLRFSSIEDIHVIFRMSQLKVLYILVTQSQRKYRRRRIPDAKKFYIISARDIERTE